MYAFEPSGALTAAGPVDASLLIAAALAFLLAYLDLVEPLTVDDDVAVGIRATSLSLLVVFVAIVLIRTSTI